MKKILNQIYYLEDKIGKQNFILLGLIIAFIVITGLYQTFSLFTSSEGISLLDGIKTYKFILGADNVENSVTVAVGSSKNIAITVSNNDKIKLQYGIYYTSNSDLTDVDLGYQHDTEYLPNGFIDSGEDYIVTIKVYNNSQSNVTIQFGILYGLETGGDLVLGENQYWLDIIYPYKTEVEYLESTGSQYIDTGIAPNNMNIKVQVQYQYLNNTFTTNDSIMGSRDNSDMKTRYYPSSLGDIYDRSVYGSTAITRTYDFLKHTVIFNDEEHNYYLDGILVGNLGSDFTPHNQNIYLFGLNTEGHFSYQSASRIFYCKIWDNGVLVRNYIPVIDRDGEPCLYDKVNDQFYYNLGSNRFLVPNSSSLTLADKVINLYQDGNPLTNAFIAGDNAKPIVIQNKNQGIMLDNNEEYRYYGMNPNNYVRFNNELWRIISVSNVKSGVDDLTGSNRVKIIRNESIGQYSWDSSLSSVNSGYGVNNWEQADLKNLLNDLYYYRKSGNCYNGQSDSTVSCDFGTIGFRAKSKGMIGNTLWYLGGNPTYSNLYVNDYYNFERGTVVYDCSTDDGKCPRTTNWTGNIGIMYASDYMYATDLSECFSVGFNGTDTDYRSNSCIRNNWLYNDSQLRWVLSLYSGNSHDAFYINSTGHVGYNRLFQPFAIYPVVYLNSDILVVAGEGTKDNPYILFNPNHIPDLTSNQNDGINYNGEWNQEKGQIQLNGTDAYIDCGMANYEFGDQLSFVARVNLHDISNENELWIMGNWDSAGGGFSLLNGKVIFSLKKDGTSSYNSFVSDYTLQTNTWYTIVGTYNGTNLSLYINGEKISWNSSGTAPGYGTNTNLLTGNVSPSKVSVALGVNLDYGSSYKEGVLNATYSDALIFKRALTESEISSNYVGEINLVNKENLVLYYNFEK